MSRIGKKPITIPTGVEVTITGHSVAIKGPKGTLRREFPAEVKIAKEKDHLVCSIPPESDKAVRAKFGLVRSLLNNMVIGVTKGFTRELEVVGLGYKVKAEGPKVTFNIGYSHPVVFEPPKEVSLKVEPGAKQPGGLDVAARVIVTGIDKQMVGQVAADIRAIKPPCHYKGTGIRYAGEQVRIKEGKKLAA
ncbi:MAG: LSU ribosomal protein L6p (L9e) [Candidatus Ozemobacter sibiricus]|jgi:large subunit ribosomal protein L6|uniref:Large ribosomal subunit protein uL6 n=1 Tax=Candidatus Ozemobacter sibiricus TaxID=2268124 RepID=A0A367ZK36_9BACT|nr:MAG: LSU ribosomal protein L6p (L9e) [Candidatus Ozemobacter sibiricus]